MNHIILEDGYETDYIYSLIIGIFYTSTEGICKLLHSDMKNVDAYYIQEYIKSKFIYQIHRNMSIGSALVNRFRIFMYNCGWLRSTKQHILAKAQIDKFYTFLISETLEYNIRFSKIDLHNNLSVDHKYPMIRITDKMLDPRAKIGCLSSLTQQWICDHITENGKHGYTFSQMPMLVPIYLDTRDPATGLNRKPINIQSRLRFDSNGDTIQRMFEWEIHSLVCQTSTGDYYVVVVEYDETFTAYSDKAVPSNWKIDNSDLASVRKLMYEARFVFYRLQ